jgi:citrate lyase subunit beta / citryl-CoA lyase
VTTTPVARSMLYMPVVERRFVTAAWRRGSDAIILDLEDSVPPHLKAHARTLVKEAIGLAARGGAWICVRINSESVLEDLDAAVWPGLELVIRPKAEHAVEISEVDAALSGLERARSIEQGTIAIWPLIETAVGVTNAYEIAAASDRVTMFGGGQGYDMSLDLGVAMFGGFDQFLYGRGEAELASRALGKEPANCLFYPDESGEVADAAWARAYAETLKSCGFRTSTALHPGAVDALNQGMTPTPAEIEAARSVLARVGHLALTEEGWVEAGGQVIDCYEVDRARRLIEWAQACATHDAAKDRAVAAMVDAEPGSAR